MDESTSIQWVNADASNRPRNPCIMDYWQTRLEVAVPDIFCTQWPPPANILWCRKTDYTHTNACFMRKMFHYYPWHLKWTVIFGQIGKISFGLEKIGLEKKTNCMGLTKILGLRCLVKRAPDLFLPQPPTFSNKHTCLTHKQLCNLGLCSRLLLQVYVINFLSSNC